MKKYILIMSIFASIITQAQLKVNNSGFVIMPNNVTFKTDGNLYIPGSQDIRFGGDAAGTNPNWSIENIGGGLNFWKPAGTNIGDYKLFLKDDGKVGIGTNNPLAKLHINGDGYIPLGSSMWFNATNDVGTRLRLFTTGSDAFIDYSSRLLFRYGSNGSMYGVIFHPNGYQSINYFYQQGYTNPTYPLEVNGMIKVNGTLIPSDAKLKENVKDISNSSSLLKKIKSVTYDYKKEIDLGISPISNGITNKSATNSKSVIVLSDSSTAQTDTSSKSFNQYFKLDSITTSRKHYGFLAQDIQKVIPDIVYVEKNGLLSIDYISLIPILVESFQEQQELIDAQTIELANQKNEISNLKQTILENQKNIQNCCSNKSKLKADDVALNSVELSNETSNATDIKLYQNAPNPFKDKTTILLDIPNSVTKAMVIMYDLTGKQIKSYNITEKGKVSLIIDGNILTAGMYHYALIADDVLIDTKLMVLTE